MNKWIGWWADAARTVGLHALVVGAVASLPLASAAQPCGGPAVKQGSPWSAPVPGDITASGSFNQVDALCAMIGVLKNACATGTPPACMSGPATYTDYNCDAACNVVDVQLAQLAAIGVDLSPAMDADGNQIPDACEPVVPCPPWSHALTVDGDRSDWSSSALFATATGGSTEATLTWDATNIYVGVQHPTVATGGAQDWLLITIGSGGAGAADGAMLNSQQPALPFGATHVIRWKADDSFDSALVWNGSAWQDQVGWLAANGGSKAESNGNQVVEFAIPRAALGVTDPLDIHVGWVFEGTGSESSFGSVPHEAWPEAHFDPDTVAYFHFDLSSPDSPDTVAPTRGTWSDALVVDGSDGDWLSSETFATSAGQTVAITWTAADVFVGVKHPDVATGGPEHWVVITLGDGTTPGASEGAALNTQAPGLPFGANYQVQWKADGSFNRRMTRNGAVWLTTAMWLGNDGSAAVESGQVVEFRLPRAFLGLTNTLDIAVHHVFEGSGNESSYSVAPASSFTEGAYDPNLATYYRFDLVGIAPPAPATPLP